MHKQRIITGIEKVFEGYAKDEELIEAITASSQSLALFRKGNDLAYFLTSTAEVLGMRDGKLYSSSFRSAAESYFNYFRFRCKPPVTVTKAKEKLAEDLGVRVEALRKGYTQILKRQ